MGRAAGSDPSTRPASPAPAGTQRGDSSTSPCPRARAAPSLPEAAVCEPQLVATGTKTWFPWQLLPSAGSGDEIPQRCRMCRPGTTLEPPTAKYRWGTRATTDRRQHCAAATRHCQHPQAPLGAARDTGASDNTGAQPRSPQTQRAPPKAQRHYRPCSAPGPWGEGLPMSSPQRRGDSLSANGGEAQDKDVRLPVFMPQPPKISNSNFTAGPKPKYSLQGEPETVPCSP